MLVGHWIYSLLILVSFLQHGLWDWVVEFVLVFPENKIKIWYINKMKKERRRGRPVYLTGIDKWGLEFVT